MKVHVLGPPSGRFNIIRKEQRRVLRGHLAGRSRKGETEVGLPRSPADTTVHLNEQICPYE